MEETQAKIVEQLESSKARLIEAYMELQDQADELNERIYGLCCEIEALNRRIAAARVRARVHGPGSNGKLCS